MAFACHNDQDASFKCAGYMRQVCLPVGCYDAGEDRDLLIGECKGIREFANHVRHSRFCFFEPTRFARIPGLGYSRALAAVVTLCENDEGGCLDLQ